MYSTRRPQTGSREVAYDSLVVLKDALPTEDPSFYLKLIRALTTILIDRFEKHFKLSQRRHDAFVTRSQTHPTPVQEIPTLSSDRESPVQETNAQGLPIYTQLPHADEYIYVGDIPILGSTYTTYTQPQQELTHNNEPPPLYTK